MMKQQLQLNKWLFGGSLALLMLLVFANYVFKVRAPEVMFLGLTLVMICSSQRNNIVATLIMCIPLSMVFGTTYTFVAGFLLWILWYREQIHINLSIVPILLMILWELPHCLGEVISIKWLIVEFIPFFFCGLLMWQDSSKLNYGFIVRCFAICTVVMCLTLLGMVLVQSSMNLTLAFANMQRLGVASEEEATGAVLQINPNSLGIICVLAITGLLQQITTGRGKPADLPLAVVMLFCGMMTTSKTFLLMVLIMVLLFWLTQEGSIWKKLRFLLLAAVVGVFVLVMLTLIFPVVIENFIFRLTADDFSSGRTVLFNTYNKYLYSHPEVLLFGIGLTNFGDKIVNDYGIAANVPHNGVQEALVAWGIPGLLLFLAFLATMLWYARKAAGKQRLVNYIPLLLLLAKIQLGQMLTSGYTMLAFAYCYLSLAYNFEPEQIKSPTTRKFHKKTLDN